MFTFSGLRSDLVGVTMFPAMLNNRSDAQLVAEEISGDLCQVQIPPAKRILLLFWGVFGELVIFLGWGSVAAPSSSSFSALTGCAARPRMTASSSIIIFNSLTF